MLRTYAAEGRWPDLFHQVQRLQGEMNRLFSSPRFAVRSEFPPVNVWTGTDGAIVKAEVPGVSPDQLDITVHQDIVTLRGKRDVEPMGDDAIVHRQERPHGPFTRTFTLPFRVDGDKVSARFERGVLTLELPRPVADKPRQIKVARG